MNLIGRNVVRSVFNFIQRPALFQRRLCANLDYCTSDTSLEFQRIAKEALEKKNIWKFALNLGYIVENIPSSVFEHADGLEEPPCPSVEFYSRTLSSCLHEMFSYGKTEVHSGLALEKGVQPYCIAQSSLSGIMVEIEFNPTDEKEVLKKIESNDYFSRYENFLDENGFRAKLRDWKYISKWSIGLNIYVDKKAKTVITRPVVKEYYNERNPKFGLVAVLTSNSC